MGAANSKNSMVEELLRDEPGFEKARAAIRETVDKIRNEYFFQRWQREARYRKYIEAQGLYDALAGGDTVLISARWLRNQKPGYVLPKRGEIPEEALISADELRRSYEGRGKRMYAYPIIAVSHCWRTQVHPDPEGVTTRILQERLRRHQRYFMDACGFSDVGIFFDWCSLWQSPRTPEQLKSFKRALPAINLWYAHRKTLVYLITDARVPHADGRTLGYADKGWTMFEFALASKVKIGSNWQVRELGDTLGTDSWTPEPPNEPLSFFKGHRYGKQFYTNGADQDTLVAPLYKQATEDILGGVKELCYDDQKWEDIHAARLGLVLPLCVSLLKLAINVGLTVRGLRAILEPVVDDKALPKLETLAISRNRGLGDDGARALGAALKQGAFENLRRLEVIDCNLTATGLRAILEPIVNDKALPKLEDLYISFNNEIGDDGARALGAVLQELRVRGCNLSATSLHAILEPVVKNRAVPKLEELVFSGIRLIDDEGAFALGAALKKQGALDNLKVLSVRNCSLTAAGLRAILEPIVDDNAVLKQGVLDNLKVPRVCYCSLSAAGLRAILEPIVNDKAMPKLEVLDISGNEELGDEGARALGAALKQGAFENLRRLEFIDCNLTATGLRAILDPIVNDKALPKLQALRFRFNGGDDEVDALVAEARKLYIVRT